MRLHSNSLAMAMLALCAASVLALTGCSAMSEHDEEMSGGPYDLTFAGGATFHGPHGGQSIHVALVDSDSGKVVARKEGTVSKTADPAFSFTFEHALRPETDYEVHYWIDSNFANGTPGKCDTKDHDHQWNVKLGEAYANVNHVEKHEPARMSPVCDSFQSM